MTMDCSPFLEVHVDAAALVYQPCPIRVGSFSWVNRYGCRPSHNILPNLVSEPASCKEV